MIPEYELTPEEAEVAKIKRRLREIEREELFLQQRHRTRKKRRVDQVGQVAQSRCDPIANAEQPTHLELIARGARNLVLALNETHPPRWAKTDEQTQAATSIHPKHGRHTWGIRSHGRVTPVKEDSGPPTSSKCCMRGVATAFDDPGFIGECTKVATLTLQIFDLALNTLDATKGESVLSKNTILEFGKDTTLFQRCYYMELNRTNRSGSEFRIDFMCPWHNEPEEFCPNAIFVILLGCGLMSREEWMMAVCNKYSGSHCCCRNYASARS